jgi:hypothetical protein
LRMPHTHAPPGHSEYTVCRRNELFSLIDERG